jgi:hypothetical protein
MASRFVFLRMTRMNGVNLNLFQFDYDLTWMSFFLDADCRIYSRYGGRDSQSADGRLSAAGLLYTMNEVLRIHRAAQVGNLPTAKMPELRRPEDIPTLNTVFTRQESDCIHCHMIPDALYEQRRQAGKFTRDSLWTYPLPESVGLRLDLVRGNQVQAVSAGSPAAKAGLRAGDLLRAANEIPVHSSADLQFALNSVGPAGKLTIKAVRADKLLTVDLNLHGNWRWQDISSRKSIRELPPRVGFYGTPLNECEKTALGIAGHDLGFKLLYIEPSSPATKAGLRPEDVIVAVDGRRKLLYLQLRSYFPLEHKSGDQVDVVYLRGGREQKVTIQLE